MSSKRNSRLPVSFPTAFTVIELTVAIFVVLVAIVAASTIVSQAGKLAKAGEWQKHAASVAREAVMVLEAAPFDQLEERFGSQFQKVVVETAQGRVHRYQWGADVALLSPSLAQVTIHVMWNDNLGARGFRASRLIARRELP